MAAISFLAGSTTVNNLAGSGLGFYGAGYGISVPLNDYQTTTFTADEDLEESEQEIRNQMMGVNPRYQ